jgi:hypothetical protein
LLGAAGAVASGPDVGGVVNTAGKTTVATGDNA